MTKALARTPRSLDQTTILHFLGPQKPWKMTFHQPRVQWPAIAHYRQVARAWTQAYQPTLPLISVLLDTAHDETYLLEQLESLLCQSYGQLEVIIVTAADVPAADSPLAQLLALNANLHLVAQAGSTLHTGGKQVWLLLTALSFSCSAPLTASPSQPSSLKWLPCNAKLTLTSCLATV